MTQGVAIAAGLQKKFDWAGVAASGIVSAVGGAVSNGIGGKATAGAQASWKNTLISGLAGGVAGAGVRSAIDGSDFGENLAAALPDVAGAVIGLVVSRQLAAGGQGGSKALDDKLLAEAEAYQANPFYGRKGGLLAAADDGSGIMNDGGYRRGDLAMGQALETVGTEDIVVSHRRMTLAEKVKYDLSVGATYLAGWGRYQWNSPAAPAIPFVGANALQLRYSAGKISSALQHSLGFKIPKLIDFGAQVAMGPVGQINAVRTLIEDPMAFAGTRDATFGDALAVMPVGRVIGPIAKVLSGSMRGAANAAMVAAESNIARGLSGTSVVSPARAETFLVKNGFDSADARRFIGSFDGPITARIVRPGEDFLRYTGNPNGTGSFLTKSRFGSPASAIDGLYLGRYGNSATYVQTVTSSGRSIVLEGAIRNGGTGIGQTVIHNRGAFTFGTGQGF